MEILDVQNLCKKLHGKNILDGISVTVKKGESVGLVGMNGAGKTSILKCISGLWHASSGEIYINGFSLKRRPHDCISKMGVLIEYPSLFPNMTLGQNIEYFGSFYEKDCRTEANKLAEVLELTPNLNQKIRTFSSGMKQKACLLIVLMKKPSVLLLDEPTSMLDPKSAAEIRKFLRNILTEKHISLVISSHNLTEIESLCDRAILIDSGKITGEISLCGRKSRLYLFDFSDEATVRKVYERSSGFPIALQGNSLCLDADGATLKRFLSEVQPDFIDLRTCSDLENTFLDRIKERA